MKNPIQEISDNYYNSNSISHVPKIVESNKKIPIGLNKDIISEIAKEYCKLMINSKNKKILNFFINYLDIKNEIRDLYFKNKY